MTVTFTFATFNVDQARREEQYEATKWDNRKDAVRQLILDADCDIVCLQELRNLSTSETGVTQFLASLTGYDFVYDYYCEHEFSFATAILYKRSKFSVMQTSKSHYHNQLDSDKLLFGVCFVPVGGSFDFFWIYSTHLDMAEDRKTVSVNKLVKEFAYQSGFLVAGDFNFFDDMGGKEQRKLMLQHFDDLAHPLENASGTFLGFDHDPHKQPANAMSRLDHIFAKGIKRIGAASAFGATAELLESRTYPSDHMMIVVTCEL